MVDIMGSADEKMMMEVSQSQSKSLVLHLGAPVTAPFTGWSLCKSSILKKMWSEDAADFTDWLECLTATYSQKNQKRISVVVLLGCGGKQECNHREMWLLLFSSSDAVANSNDKTKSRGRFFLLQLNHWLFNNLLFSAQKCIFVFLKS